MKFLIFSDESGSWHEGDYYIRSWVKITPQEYISLQKEMLYVKHAMNIKELKWKNFYKNSDKFNAILVPKFEIFITISKPEHFKNKKYKIIESIKSVSISTGGEDFTKKIKDKIIKSAENELFLNYFEKIHIENSRLALVNDSGPNDFLYLIDSPQFLSKSWKNTARECAIENIEIVKDSKTVAGIEIADIVAGCINGLLSYDKKATALYHDLIKPKMIDLTSSKYPNPNLIFYSDFTSDQYKKINIFR